MPRIINPFRGTDPIAQTISELGQNMFAGRLDRDLKSQQLYKAQRENAETDNLMGMVSDQGGAAPLATSPVAHAMIIGSGYKPEDFGKLGLLQTAVKKGAADPLTQSFQVGTGQSYDNTADAVNAKLAETRRNNDLTDATERYKFDNDLVEAVVAGHPTYMRRADASFMQPVISDAEAKGTLALDNWGTGFDDLNPAQKSYIGADVAGSGRTPRNYVAPNGAVAITYDGVTNAQTGQPLPPGGYIAGVEGANAKDALGLTTQSTNDDQGTIRRVDEFMVLSKELRSLAETRPDAFGLLGNIRGNLQEAVQIVPALQTMFGGQDLNAAAADMLQQFSINPQASAMFTELASTYDGNLPTVRTLGVMIKYQLIAAALGQNGRDLSDKDLVQGEKLFPDPQGIFSSAQSTLATLNLFDRLMANKRAAAVQRLQAGSIQSPAPSAPPSPTPVPSSEGDVEEGTIIENDAGQRMVLRNGQWEPL